MGAFLLGKALSGCLGAIAALLLAVVDPLYLAQSQTMQAEASSAAFSFLAMGLALFWWKYPSGKRGLLLAVLTGVTVALSILSKLLGVALLIPTGMFMLTRLWQISAPTKTMNSYIAIAAGILAFLLTTILVMLPFLGSFQAMVASVITFHTDAASMLSNNPQFSQSGNLLKVESALTTLLALTALYGTAAALLRQDWRVLPLLGWLLATAFLLWRQVPLFSHHFVSLTPPLIALSVMGIADPSAYRRVFSTSLVSKVAIFLTWATVLLILLTAVLDARQDRIYYRNAAASSVDGTAQLEARVAANLRAAIAPDQQVVTDGQFVAALANRDTPPALVDTSMVRIETHYLTLGQLESIASQPQVHAVLFFTGRFHLPNVAAFHAWVARHFRLLRNYGGGRELWGR
ncbi:MAG: phospholipid carrier-dependent glycosyltransferase [Chloroflexi bacterium]|nr:MAG: phospholipid carrier-dependent glycosyltransferase [Chloroflexota bacterium]